VFDHRVRPAGFDSFWSNKTPTRQERGLMVTDEDPSKMFRWPGISGVEYDYYIYDIESNFKYSPGNYIFAKEVGPGTWLPLYIGQTGDLSERFEDHHKIDCVLINGATHLHVHLSSTSEEIRREEEKDLIDRWRPFCQG